MQRFSVSVDDDLAAWIEDHADERGVSKAKTIRDAVETAMITGLVQHGEDEIAHGENLAERVTALETRVEALEGESGDASADEENGSKNDTDGIIAVFESQLEDRPPTTDHGQAAVVRVFELLVENGPMKTAELRETIYPEFEEQFSSAESMWQSTQRFFDDLSGIEKAGHGEWDADPSSVVNN